MTEQKPLAENDCSCECQCCQEGKCQDCNCKECQCQEKPQQKDGFYWQMRNNDTVGASFLGILAILLLVFLVRANRRNRELLLEVIKLRRQS